MTNAPAHASPHQAASPIEALRAVLATGSFRFDRQPIVAMPGVAVAGFELLARFDLPYPVATLVEAAEAANLVEKIDLAAARAALAARDRGEYFYSVNVSARSLACASFGARLAQSIACTHGGGHGLIIELTETAKLDHLPTAADTLHRLRGLGCQVWLDDFGEGFGALEYLRTLPADAVKLRAHAGDWLLGPLVRMVGELGLAVIVEMIETETQARTAAQAGAAFGQGYLFGRPQRWSDKPALAIGA
ncbi:MAG: EAL domain-containing protein [Caulobacterales bacterium]|jgi:EAL domain-containing protein (putative c-di-GMP-specific phosphodiesterase class I)